MDWNLFSLGTIELNEISMIELNRFLLIILLDEKLSRFDGHLAGIHGDVERCKLDQNITTSLYWTMLGQHSTELRSTLGQCSVELRSKSRQEDWLPHR